MNTSLRGNAHPESFSARAQYLDGVHAVPKETQLSIEEDSATLVGALPGGDVVRWPLAQVREVPDQAGGDLFVLRLRNDPLQRLILTDRALASRLPNLTRRAPVTKRGRLLIWALAAVASVALIIGVLVPKLADQLAEFIPEDGQKALGSVTLDQIRAALDQSGLNPVPVCDGAGGQQALDKMRDRLGVGAGDLPDLSLYVLDHEMLNAFALPGGTIVFFRGLIEAAETPEEVVAVLAHEIGHVVSRDPTRHALRSAGSIGVLGLLFGDFAGGTVVLFLTERLIDAQYSQGAEAAADVFAHRLLRDSALRPDALASMFERFRERGGDADGFVAHFLSHPALGNRIEAARDATPPDFTARPVMSDAEWVALKTICD